VLGALLCAAFTAWAVVCVRRLPRAPPARGLGTSLACACLLWTAINLFYLGNMVYGYAQDLTNPRLHPPH